MVCHRDRVSWWQPLPSTTRKSPRICQSQILYRGGYNALIKLYKIRKIQNNFLVNFEGIIGQYFRKFLRFSSHSFSRSLQDILMKFCENFRKISKLLRRKPERQKVIMKYHRLEKEKIIHIMVFNLFLSY